MKTLTSTALAFSLALALPVAAQDVSPGAHFIENWDADGDGRVSRAEATEKRADIFTMFDQDEDDALSPAEYDAFDETRAEDMANNAEAHGGGAMGMGQGHGKGAGQGMGQGMGQGPGKGQGMGMGPGGGASLGDYVRSMDRGYADADKDGVVTRAEFEGVSADWFAQRDRDGDGFITEADFGPRG